MPKNEPQAPMAPGGRKELPPPVPPPGSVGPDGSVATSATGSKSVFDSTKSVMSAIKKYEAEVGLAFEEIPPDVCEGRVLELAAWSLIATNNTLRMIAEKTEARVQKKKAQVLANLDFDPLVQSAVETANRVALETARNAVGLERLNLHGAVDIGDIGLKELGEHCPMIRHLDIGSAFRVSDVGLRCVTMACTGLESLSLSGCLGVTGVGLAVVGETAPTLLKLDITNCQQLANWAFQRVCSGCPLLEDVNVSMCVKITDHDIRVLAENCPRLRKLNVRDTRQVSDEGLVAVAKNCPAMEWLDTSRTEMAFKITDVGLLSLAEKCPLMKYIRCDGCDNLTDVGMSWIGRGCRGLQHLDLKNCTKISNAGVRTIAENCVDLEYLDLGNMKRVTDVGVRFIATNCPKLRHLNLSGMYLITDGMKRDFGHEGLQALGASDLPIKYLHLVGCFQVQNTALKFMARSSFASGLQDLSFAGCPKIEEKAFISLMQHCPSLTALSLAGCTEVVTNPMIVAVGKTCHQLQKLDLTECENVGEPATKALVLGCRKLIHLDLTGCSQLNDFAMLPFADAQFRPGLQTLSLVGCPSVGDMSLAWLADGLCNSLVQMNLLGTRCTRNALKSVADRFRYSKQRKNPQFFGLYPEHRWKDRIVINDFGVMYRCATKLQAAHRARMGRRMAALRREEFLRHWVASRLQSLWRSKQARILCQLLAWEKVRRHDAAVVIQGFARIIDAKERVRILREEAAIILMHRCATHIQAVWRGILARRRVMDMLITIRERMRLEDRCARYLQRVYRGYAGKKLYQEALRRHRELQAKKKRMATNLQRVIRGRQSRKRTAAKRKALADQAAREQAAAIMLQGRWRTYMCRKIIKKASKDRKKGHRAATKIQGQWRRKVAHGEMMTRKLMRQQRLEEEAALTIQGAQRCRAARADLRRRLAERGAYQEKLEDACRYVQRAFRGYKARQRVRILRENQEELARKMIELENWAANTVQAGWRGKKGREVYNMTVMRHKSAWKEMYDETELRPFYYNQISGEIRWRKPQPMLDLMRRPLCTNCEFYDAVNECQTCNEFYCSSCWDTIHYGGKRKRHKFRALFDFYDKRIDYGDDEFPSKWPTEIEQDDMIGWQLRVGEDHRDPDAEQGVWQRYDDEELGRSFFYNTATQEGMYDEPPEWEAAAPQIEQAAEETGGFASIAGALEGDQNQLDYEQSNYSYEHSDGSLEVGGVVYYKAIDAEGHEYYYNSVTGESSYEPPTAVVPYDPTHSDYEYSGLNYSY